MHAGVAVKGSSPFPIVVAALGAQMLKVTAELADGTLHVVHRAGDARRAHHPDDQRRRRGGRPADATGDRRPAGVRHRPTSPARASGRPRSSPSTASCRATGRCSIARAPPGRPTSPSSAAADEVAEQVAALAEHRRHRLRRRRVRRRPRRGRGDDERHWSVRCPADELAGAGRWRRLDRRTACSRRARGAHRRGGAARSRPTPSRRPTGRRRPTLEWSPCPDLDRRADAWSGSARGSTSRSTTTTRPASTIAVALTRPGLDAGDTRRPLVAQPRRPGRVRHRAGLVPRRPAARATCSTHYYPVGWDPRGVGRSLPAVDCGDVDADDVPDAEDVHRPDRSAARPGRRGRRRPRPRRRSAPPSASSASTTSATATARRSARCTRWPTPTASGGSCSTVRSTRRRAIRTARSPPTACRTTPPTRLDDVIDRFHELCDASRVRRRPGQPGARRRARLGTIRDLPTADFPGDPAQMDRIDLDDVMVGVTLDPWSWGLVGDALARRRRRRRLDARRAEQLPARRLPGRDLPARRR